MNRRALVFDNPAAESCRAVSVDRLKRADGSDTKITKAARITNTVVRDLLNSWSPVRFLVDSSLLAHAAPR